MELRIERAKLKDYKEVVQEIIDTLQPESCIDFLINYFNEEEQITDKFEKLFYNCLERYLMDMIIDYNLTINKDKDFKKLYANILMQGCSRLDDYDISEYIEEITFFNANDFYPILKKYLQCTLDEVVEKTGRTQKEEEIRKAKEILEFNHKEIAKYKEYIERLKKEIAECEEKLKKVTG